VAYILGITRVDPIKNKLFLGRFLNEEMSAVPDIDIDVSTAHRERLIQYVYEKYERGMLPWSVLMSPSRPRML
jgi:error-prone DNA polymerase